MRRRHCREAKSRSVVLLLLLLALLVPGEGHGNPYFAVPLPDVNGVKQHYLIVGGRARLIDGPESLEVLDPGILPELGSLAELNRTHPIGDPLPHFSFGGKTPDDCVRVYTMKSSVFNGDDLMLDYSSIGEYMNPSVLLFRKRLLVIAPLQIGDTGPEHRKPTGTIEFKWLNSSKHPFYTSDEYLGVSEQIRALNWLFVGEDPRVLYYNDSFFQVYYTYTGRWLGRNHQKMGMADISYLPSEGRINITYLASPIVGKVRINSSSSSSCSSFSSCPSISFPPAPIMVDTCHSSPHQPPANPIRISCPLTIA